VAVDVVFGVEDRLVGLVVVVADCTAVITSVAFVGSVALSHP
jgi:hypothetical protein